VAIGLLLAAGCAQTPPPADPIDVPPPLPAPEPDPVLSIFPRAPGERAFERMSVPKQQLSIPLPNRSGWRSLPDPGTFVVLEHAATRSRLLLRVWREPEVMSRQACEERARLLRELPPSGGELGTSRVDAPRGFDTKVVAGVATTEPGEPLVGYLVAFGASVHRCFALAYTTEASGPSPEETIGNRLAVVEGLIVRGIRLERDLPARVSP
jgi:hypothetical protein